MKGATSSAWDAGRYIVMSVHAGKHLQNIKNAEMSMYVSGSREEVFCSYSGCLTYKNINERGRKQ